MIEGSKLLDPRDSFIIICENLSGGNISHYNGFDYFQSIRHNYSISIKEVCIIKYLYYSEF